MLHAVTRLNVVLEDVLDRRRWKIYYSTSTSYGTKLRGEGSTISFDRMTHHAPFTLSIAFENTDVDNDTGGCRNGDALQATIMT